MIYQKIGKYILASVVFIALLGMVFFGMQWFSQSVLDMLIRHDGFFQGSLQTSVDGATAYIQQAPDNPKMLPYRNWQVEELLLEAKSAISIEIGSNNPNKVLFKKNEQQVLPIASLTKLMTALVVLERYDLDQKVAISSEAMAQEGEQGGLELGQIFSVKDLLHISLMESSNRAAYALSEVVGNAKFIDLMNEDVQKLGLTNTHFEDATGLDSASYSTVKDIVRLSEYLFEKYPLFTEIISLKEYPLYMPDGTLHHVLINTNKLLGYNGIIGGKTGFTDSAKGCFLVIQNSRQQGNHIITVVLGAQDRFLEMQKIMYWVDSAYQW